MENMRMDYIPFWTRYLAMFRRANLTKLQAGELLFALLEYQQEGKEPGEMDQVCSIFWGFLLEDLNRAQQKYEKAVKNGKKGGRPKKAKESEKNLNKPISTTTSTTTPTSTPTPISTTTSTTTPTSTPTPTSASTSIDTGSAPALTAGVCCDEQSFGEFGWVKLTQQQYDKLLKQLGFEELRRCITYVDEAAQSTGNRNRWKDWYLILRRCHENHWYETRHFSTKPEIPKGASGVLGEAELEAIARVLRE